jgi:anti-sigma factor RsiW
MTAHADLAKLLAYWLGELDAASEAALEEHYLGCAECSSRLAEVEAFADGVQRAFADGRVGAIVTPAFVEQVRARGLRVREYRVPPNGSVNCSVDAGDQVLFGRMQVPLQGVTRVDAVLLFEGEHRFEDIPFDAAAGEVVLAPGVARIRAMPSHREVVRLIAVEAGAERVLGEYTFNHAR